MASLVCPHGRWQDHGLVPGPALERGEALAMLALSRGELWELAVAHFDIGLERSFPDTVEPVELGFVHFYIGLERSFPDTVELGFAHFYFCIMDLGRWVGVYVFSRGVVLVRRQHG